MGLFGGICRAIKSVGSAVVSGVKKVGGAIVDGAKKVGGAIKNGCTNVWNKFSGKDTFKEAEELYEKISKKYNERRKKFEEDVSSYSDKIEKHVQSINAAKKRIKTELFVQMAETMKKMKDIPISKEFVIEEYQMEEFVFDNLRSKEQLYKIDFNKHKFKTTMQAIFTLGFYTRKKAKETLYAVQEEEAKINTEIAKMDTETAKLKAIEMSLENVEYYFKSLMEDYEILLVRLDNSFNFLQARCLAFAHKILRQEISMRKLPIVQCKEVMAIVSISKILKAMVEENIVAVDDVKKVETYKGNMEKQYKDMRIQFEAA